MTDFTREDMRERLMEAIVQNSESTEFVNADALMDELGLWKAYEALREITTAAYGFRARKIASAALAHLRGEQPK